MIAILYREELKALMRGRFAWLGAGVLLLAVGGLATVATQDTWLDGYGIIAYGLVPLAFIPLSAGVMASPRANRFVESLFTAPVERRDWFIAKLLVLLTLALGYYVALLPMLAVYLAHVGMPVLLSRLLLWAPGLLISSVAVGTLIGVLFIGRSIAAPTGTGMGVLLFYLGLLPLQELMVAQGHGASRTGHLTLASPAVLLKNALGFTVATGTVPATTAGTWLAAALVVVLALTLATWIFLRAQGVETWDTTRAQRWIIGLGIATIAVSPTVLADTNYDKAAPPTSSAPPIRGLFARGGSAVGLTPPGAQLPSRCCGTILNHDEWPSISTDESTRRDLFILFPVDATQRLVDLHVQIAGDNGLQVRVDSAVLDSLSAHLETRTYSPELGPAASDGHRIVNGWIARIPVVIQPTRPWDTGGMRYPIDVTATYRVAGDTTARMVKTRAAIEAQIWGAFYQMGVASAGLPLVCFAAAFVRWRRTR
jgi:ABC-type transport system involved in multi-copper enzyme maturation permease subunit